KGVHAALRGAGADSAVDPGQRRLRDSLVIAEVAIAFLLAVGAAALIRELVRLRNADTGMVTRNVVTLHLGRRMVVRGRERPLASDVGSYYEITDRVSRLP